MKWWKYLVTDFIFHKIPFIYEMSLSAIIWLDMEILLENHVAYTQYATFGRNHCHIINSIWSFRKTTKVHFSNIIMSSKQMLDVCCTWFEISTMTFPKGTIFSCPKCFSTFDFENQQACAQLRTTFPWSEMSHL